MILDNYTQLDPDELVVQLQCADDAYFNDVAIVDDATYDTAKRYAKRLLPTHEYFIGVGASVRGGKVDLPYQMGSLNQLFTNQEIAAWAGSTHAAVCVMSHKLDGNSGMVVYDDAGKFQISYSRGDGFQGADTTRHLSRIPSVPKQITGRAAIRGELIISKPNFDKMHALNIAVATSGKPYKNPRNMMSGVSNAESPNPELYPYIDFVAYEIVGSPLSKTEQLVQLAEWGFKVVPYSTAAADQLSDAMLSAYIKKARESSVYELDGAVIEIDDASSRLNNKTNDLNPEYAFKFKINDDANTATAVVDTVEWNVSKDGYYKPRIKIEPIQLLGVTVTHATGFNAKFIVDNGIDKGATIRIIRSGDVIPYVSDVLTPSPHGASSPQGSHSWNATGVDLVVDNIDSHPEVQVQRMVYFFDTIKSKHFGEGNIRTLVAAGFTSASEVIELTPYDLGVVFGRNMGSKIYQGIHEQLHGIPAYTLMAASSAFARGLGVRKLKKLYDAFRGDMSKCANVHHVLSVPGFDVTTAQRVVTGYERWLTFLPTVAPHVTIEQYVEKTGEFLGKNIVVTGFRDPRIEAYITNNGGEVKTTVSSKTSLVIAANPSENSGKLSKARTLNIPIVSLATFKEQNNL